MPARKKQVFYPSQISWPVIGLVRPEGSGGYSSEANAVFAAWAAANQPASVGQKQFTDTYIRALKTAGIWSTRDLIGDVNVQGSTAALVNWKNPGTFNLTAQGGLTFSAFVSGYKGNGIDGILRSGYVPSTQNANFQQDSNSFFASAVVADQGTGPIAGTIPNQSHYLYADYLDNALAYNGGGPLQSANADGTKFVATDRTASNAHRLIIDATAAASGSQASVSPAFELAWLGGVDGGVTYYSEAGLELWGAGASLTNGQYTSFKTARDSYITAKRGADLIAYLGTSYFRDANFGPALPIAADAALSTAPYKALMTVKGGAITSTAQRAYWTSTVRPMLAAASSSRKKILVICPGDSDKADGSDGETTISAMIANIQAMVTEAKTDGCTVVVSTTPSWAYSISSYTESTRQNHLDFMAGMFALTGVDAICDITNDPLLYAVNAYQTSGMFQSYPTDPIPHPNGSGYARWGAVLGAAIQSVR